MDLKYWDLVIRDSLISGIYHSLHQFIQVEIRKYIYKNPIGRVTRYY
jgi:hypothetical protein